MKTIAISLACIAASSVFAAVPNPDVSGSTATFNGNKTIKQYNVPSAVKTVEIKDNVKLTGRINFESGAARTCTVKGASRRSTIEGRYPGQAYVHRDRSKVNVRCQVKGSSLILDRFTSRNSANFHVEAALPTEVNNVGFIESQREYSTDALSGVNNIKKCDNCTFDTMDDSMYFRHVKAPLKNCTFRHRSNGALLQATHGGPTPAATVELRDLKHIQTKEFDTMAGNRQGIGGWAKTIKESAGTTKVQTIKLTGKFTETKESGASSNPFFSFGSNKTSSLTSGQYAYFELTGATATEALAKRAIVRKDTKHRGKVVFGSKTFTFQ